MTTPLLYYNDIRYMLHAIEYKCITEIQSVTQPVTQSVKHCCIMRYEVVVRHSHTHPSTSKLMSM